MKSVAVPAAVLFTLIVAALTWAMWPSALERGQQAYARGDYAAAATTLRPIAEKGDVKAQVMLGRMAAAGQGAPANPVAAVEWFLKAAAQHDGGAALELGDRYTRGDGVPQSDDEALLWYRRAAAAANTTGLQRLTDLAKQGSSRAKLQLATLYVNGEGVPQNKSEAARWFREAAGRGITEAAQSLMGLASENVAEASYQLGQLYERGQGLPPNLPKAVTAYTRAANQLHLAAQVRLAELYEQGKGIRRDEAAAAEWYGKAAHQGHGESQLRYGLILLRGRGVPVNKPEAARWIGEAASNGIPGAIAPLRELGAAGIAGAQYKLASLYAEGKGVPQDGKQAVDWLRKAAEQGLAVAQFDLAYAYGAGQGTPVDNAAAAHWYGEATVQGFATAVPKLAQLANRGEPVAQFYLGRYLVNGGKLPSRPADETDDLIHAVMRWFRALRSDPVADGMALLRKAADAGNADAQEALRKLPAR
ncbi:MAG TPA: SEL1-like repeat protein [bacterium]